MRYFNSVADHAGRLSLRVGFGLFFAVWLVTGVWVAAVLASGVLSPRDAVVMVGFAIVASLAYAIFGLILAGVLIAFSIAWVSIFTALSLGIARFSTMGASPWRRVGVGALSSVVIGLAFAVRNPPDPGASLTGLATGLAAFAILGGVFGFRTPALVAGP